MSYKKLLKYYPLLYYLSMEKSNDLMLLLQKYLDLELKVFIKSLEFLNIHF